MSDPTAAKCLRFVAVALLVMSSLDAAGMPSEKENSQSKWESPLARDVSKIDRERHATPSPIDLPAQRPGRLAQTLSNVAIFALSATGKVSGIGRDTTGDIGKPPLGIHDAPIGSGIQGSIKQ